MIKKLYTYMKYSQNIDLLVNTVKKYSVIEGINELSELSGIGEFTIKANGNINKLNNHDHIKHSRKGPRKKHVWEYVMLPQNYDRKIDQVVKNADNIVIESKKLFKHWNILKNKNISEREQIKQEEKAIELQKQIAVTSNNIKYLKMFLNSESERFLDLSETRWTLYTLDEKINEKAFKVSKNMAERIYTLRFY
jgi:hypothetical protein